MPRVPVTLATANGSPLKSYGFVYLWIRVGDELSRDEFLVSEGLAVPVLLGADWNDAHVKYISPHYQTIEMMDGAVRPIIRYEYEFKIVPSRFTVPAERAILRPAIENRVKLAEAATLPPNSQMAVAVVAEVDGTVIIEPDTQLLASRGVSISHGVHRVKKFRPFKVLMANFTTRGVDLPKNTKVGQVIIGETIALATDIPLDEVVGATQDPSPGNVGRKCDKVDALDLAHIPK